MKKGFVKESTQKKIEDAIVSGYIGRDGKAVSMARRDVEGSPTGAYTDIGAGRSSVVRHHVVKGSPSK
jgi:hypothetical protein